MDLEEIKSKIKPVLKEAVETAVFVIVMVIIIRFFLGEIRWIPSGSMKPTLLEGDRIFVERVSRFFTTPKRGDIMVFYPPTEKLNMSGIAIFERLTGFFCKDIAYIKRVIGLPGDKILIKEDSDGKYNVFVNGKMLEEKYVMDEYDYIPCTQAMYCGPFTVPKGNYFMLGDNRGNSQDSRFWGFLPKERFVGRAIFLFWPLTRINKF
ncbi:MAG TPA: signal peptidase I [Candidatus Gastranaerophilaceae bacterium]|nr:signal peptidase I [Candidatus Gastranaerophilaceae bacterium]HPT42074.1 signal peptidase I [Candidatus Gastranaerophilaceae bacterium]